MLKLFYFITLIIFSLPIATEALYIRRLPDKTPKDLGINITKEIHHQFIETIKGAAWMDTDSRGASVEKVKAMKFNFGSPDGLTNDTMINEYYKDLDFRKTDSLLDIVLRIQRFSKNREILKLRRPAKIDDWTDFEMTEFSNRYFENGNRLRMLIQFFSIFIFIPHFDHFYDNYHTQFIFVGITSSFLQSLKADG